MRRILQLPCATLRSYRPPHQGRSVEAHHAKKSGTSQMGNPPDDLRGPTLRIPEAPRNGRQWCGGLACPLWACRNRDGRGICVSNNDTTHDHRCHTAKKRPVTGPRTACPHGRPIGGVGPAADPIPDPVRGLVPAQDPAAGRRPGAPAGASCAAFCSYHAPRIRGYARVGGPPWGPRRLDPPPGIPGTIPGGYHGHR